MNTKPTLQTLPLEVLLEILQYVPLPECIYLRSSCSQLEYAVDEHIKLTTSRILSREVFRDSYHPLRTMIQLLHEHTFKYHFQSEENTDIKSFLEDFNRKSEQRQKLASKIRTIIQREQFRDSRDLTVFDFLHTLRDYTERLYSFLADSFEPNSKKFKPEVTSPLNSHFEEILNRTDRMHHSQRSVNSFCAFIERSGIVYDILDLIRAQRRFAAKFQDQENYSLIEASLSFLKNVCKNEWWEIQHFLMSSPWFNQLLVDILVEAQDNYSDYFTLVRTCTILIDSLYYSSKPGVIFRQFPYIINCGVIKCLTQLAMNMELLQTDIEHLQTRHCILQALDTLLDQNLPSVQEFCSIDGSIEMLIDLLANPNDYKFHFYRYGKRNNFSVSILYSIHKTLMVNKPSVETSRQLLAIYESRDIGAMLANRVKLITPNDYDMKYDASARKLVGLLRLVLYCSLDQRFVFRTVDGALEAVERFANSNDPDMVKVAKKVLEL